MFSHIQLNVSYTVSIYQAGRHNSLWRHSWFPADVCQRLSSSCTSSFTFLWGFESNSLINVCFNIKCNYSGENSISLSDQTHTLNVFSADYQILACYQVKHQWKSDVKCNLFTADVWECQCRKSTRVIKEINDGLILFRWARSRALVCWHDLQGYLLEWGRCDSYYLHLSFSHFDESKCVLWKGTIEFCSRVAKNQCVSIII